MQIMINYVGKFASGVNARTILGPLLDSGSFQRFIIIVIQRIHDMNV